MRRLFFIVSLICLYFVSSSATAQTKVLTIDDFMTNRALYPKQMYGIVPHFDQAWFTYTNENDDLIKIDQKGAKSTFLTLTDINAALNAQGSEPLQAFPDYRWTNADILLLQDGNRLIEYSVSGKKAMVINTWNENAENVEAAPKQGYVAYTIDNNLFIASAGQTTAVTKDENSGIVNGQSVHRNEFGINKGTFWSPSGNYLAFYRMDERMVTEYPLVDISERVATADNIRYPMAGMTSHQVTLGIYNVRTAKTVFVKTGEPVEQYLCSVTWSPDEKFIYIALLNREQNHLKLNKYDALTGEYVMTLLEESNDRYVEPENPLFFVNDDPTRFIWVSERDGFQHLYLYSSEGTMIKQLTSGAWMVTAFDGYNKKGSMAYFYATKESPIESHYYGVDLKKGTISRISQSKGNHTTYRSADGSLFIDSYTSTEMASCYNLINASGKVLTNLLSDQNPLKAYKMPQMSLFTIKAQDGTDLWCRLLKPYDFDSTQKYPVIVYVYGGPHAQLVSDSWTGGSGLFLQYLASQGYIVFTLDNRGSYGRGLEFESIIHRNAGSIEVQDQMEGVNWLISQPWVDRERIGVHGWSYGGFMTISMMLKNPGVFKVGVAGGPVVDWKYYEVMYGERYMDTPQENPDGYKQSALTTHVDSLNGKLLIIQGYIDNTVVPQHCLSFIQECIKKGKFVDFFMYPRHEHNVGGRDRIHLFKLIEQYFNEHL